MAFLSTQLCEIAIIGVRDVGFILVFVKNKFSSALYEVLCYGICSMIPDLLGKAELSFSDAFELRMGRDIEGNCLEGVSQFVHITVGSLPRV